MLLVALLCLLGGTAAGLPPVCSLWDCGVAGPTMTAVGVRTEAMLSDVATLLAAEDDDAVLNSLQALNDEGKYRTVEDVALAALVSAGAEHLGHSKAGALLVPWLRARSQREQADTEQAAALAVLQREVLQEDFTCDTVVTAYALCNAWLAAGELSKGMDVCRAANAAAAGNIPRDRALAGVAIMMGFAQAPFRDVRGALSASPGGGPPRIAFVAGLPRSGTSILEQMLSRAEGVWAQGERPVMYDAVWQRLREETRMGDVAARVIGSPELAAQMAAALRAALLDGRPPHATTVINKAVQHAAYSPLLLRLLPDAKLVYLTRDPRDVALSIFRQAFDFGEEGMPWATEPAMIRAYMQSHEQAMEAALADPFVAERTLQVEYERLVAAPEAEIRRVLAFLQLPFSPDVLQPHLAQRSPGTSSNDQVREPLHTRAIGQWEPFEPWLSSWFAMSPSPGPSASLLLE